MVFIRTEKARGIILREYKSGEWDKNLTVLTREHGKLRLFAKGAARPQNRHGGSIRLFAYLDFVFYKGDGFYALNSCDPVFLFGGLTDSYEGVFYASYFAELIDKTVLEAEPCPDILDLLLYALRALEKGKIPEEVIRAAFEFKFMQYAGFAPSADVCCGCGKACAPAFFSEYGLICKACAENRTAAPVTEAAVFALKFILNKNPKELFAFTLDDTNTRSLRQAADISLRAHSDAEVKSRAFLT